MLVAAIASFLLLQCNGLVINQSTTGPVSNECHTKEFYDVIVIGAGVSGFTAAAELYRKHNIHNLTILEARSRIGGRVYTVRSDSDGTFVDMGAQFIHGEVRNSVYQFAKEQGLLAVEQGAKDADWFNLNGIKVNATEVEQLNRVYRMLRRQVEFEHDMTTSVGVAMKEKFDRWLHNSNMQDAPTKRALFYYFYMDECIEVAEDLVYLSLQEDVDSVETSGMQEYVVDNGMLSVVEHLIGDLPLLNDSIQYQSVVQKINWDVSCSEGKRVSVQLSNGKVISGRTAIVTLPLGVLKSQSVTFKPELPSAKQTAIRRLGYGCMNKIFLLFERAWWKDKRHVNTIYIDTIPDGIKVTPKYYTVQNDTWYRTLLSFNVVYGNPLALEAYVTGAYAQVVERLPIEEVASVVEQVLDRAYTKSFDAEGPIQVTKSSWCFDPYSRGALTFLHTGSHTTDLRALASPLPDSKTEARMFFAGEHTSDTQWSTVQGAWDSGKKAADEAATVLRGKTDS